ncbi:MAG: type II toxin-antitoxin system VapC family toxin [Bacteroidota bacterium]
MSGKPYLRDTNIIIAFFNGEVELVQNVLKDQVFIPFIVVGELAFGASNSSKKEQNLIQVKGFCQDAEVLYLDAETSFIYGELKSELRRRGKPIPTNDVWIAAIGKKYEMTVVTRDKHFKNIMGIEVVRW